MADLKIGVSFLRPGGAVEDDVDGDDSYWLPAIIEYIVLLLLLIYLFLFYYSTC